MEIMAEVSQTRTFRERIKRVFPILTWAPNYDRGWLRPDLIAGLTSWSLMVPVSVAYAELAGVPAQYGLYTAFAALALYALFGTSRHLKVTTSSTMAVMSAAVVAPLAVGDPVLYQTLTAALALVVGLYMIGAGILRLGFVADFLSKSVVTGFIFGLALNIIIGQIPKMLGVPGGEGNFFQQVSQLIANLPEAVPVAAVLGVSTLVAILVTKRRWPFFPTALVAVVVSIVLVRVFDTLASQVALVGEIAIGMPTIAMPRPGLFNLAYLAISALGIVFLAVGESLGAARSFAAKYDYSINADQELIALGSANIGTALLGGFAADASLSSTAAAAESGARTQLSSLVTSGLILLTVLFLAPLFSTLPYSVLGAIVTASAISLLDVAELRRLWRTWRSDFWLAIVALFGVLLTDVLTGLLVAVVLSLVLVLYRTSRPQLSVLGQVPGEPGSYADLARHPEYEVVPGLVILRIDQPLYFFNSNTALDQLLARLSAVKPAPKALLLDISASNDLDVASMDSLVYLVSKLQGQGLDVGLANVRGQVRDRLRISGAIETIGEHHIYLSVESGVHAYLLRASTDVAQQDEVELAQPSIN